MSYEGLAAKLTEGLGTASHNFTVLEADHTDELNDLLNKVRLDYGLTEQSEYESALFQNLPLLMFMNDNIVQTSITSRPCNQVKQVARGIAHRGYVIEKIMLVIPMWANAAKEDLPRYLYHKSHQAPVTRHGYRAPSLRSHVVRALLKETDFTVSTVSLNMKGILKQLRDQFPDRFTDKPGFYLDKYALSKNTRSETPITE